MFLVREWSQLIVNNFIQLPGKSKVKEIFDLANTTNKSYVKRQHQLKSLTESVELISASFDEFEPIVRKKMK